MITQAIILAGGLGTRLRSAVPDLPKCMAPINGKPFIAYVITELQQQGINNFIFSLGYKSEAIVKFISTYFSNINFELSIEEEPLGTGGAIKLACKKASQQNIIITNGDTLFKVNITALSTLHETENAACTLSLKPMQNFNRYGVVEIDETKRIISFKEKQFYKTGLINGGVYALSVNDIIYANLPEKFSFEKDYLESFYQTKKMKGFVQDDYFIDIGIPEDYLKAQKELKSNSTILTHKQND
ncbi:MAG: nucleotidyltransferase family protein [Bacteroidetes bacterium]|nr:nucleotidyltransferase family protein [Bacteroidota bacterium]MBS1650229.1 nucleotidyltransferase family protein [Bacteroidota bacterium]